MLAGYLHFAERRDVYTALTTFNPDFRVEVAQVQQLHQKVVLLLCKIAVTVC